MVGCNDVEEEDRGGVVVRCIEEEEGEGEEIGLVGCNDEVVEDKVKLWVMMK